MNKQNTIYNYQDSIYERCYTELDNCVLVRLIFKSSTFSSFQVILLWLKIWRLRLVKGAGAHRIICDETLFDYLKQSVEI